MLNTNVLSTFCSQFLTFTCPQLVNKDIWYSSTDGWCFLNGHIKWGGLFLFPGWCVQWLVSRLAQNRSHFFQCESFVHNTLRFLILLKTILWDWKTVFFLYDWGGWSALASMSLLVSYWRALCAASDRNAVGIPHGIKPQSYSSTVIFFFLENFIVLRWYQ